MYVTTVKVPTMIDISILSPCTLFHPFREWQWACRNGECIARYDMCDGIPQCSDGSDEWNCERWRQNQDYNRQGAAETKTSSTTLASSTTAANNSADARQCPCLPRPFWYHLTNPRSDLASLGKHRASIVCGAGRFPIHCIDCVHFHQSGVIVLTTREVVISFVLFALLALLIVSIVRRRARIKALSRNRRGNLLQKFQGDSDEDDILISSMYS